ncbi:MAG: bacteriophytochrome protein [Hyphomicrobiales bacterium]|nr:bacteriophytochrome protein [Hyphomicrobiales bacterium]
MADHVSEATIEATIETCASEPIRIPGAIQPYGALMVLDPQTLSCLQRSRNFAMIVGVEPDSMTPEFQQLRAEISRWRLGDAAQLLTRANMPGRLLHVTGHRSPQGLVIELEPPPATSPDFSLDGFYPRLRGFLERIRSAPDLAAIAQAAVADMRAITGFNRILLYAFDHDGHGTVIAEDNDGVLPSYQGLRFPASDIPPQARDLYRLNRIRLIGDSNYTPCPIDPPYSPVDGQPLDLSFASLRSVSPIHLEYMRNMGTGSSMSVSLVVDGELWGLISGHRREPWHVHPQTRAACESLGQILSLQIEAYLRAERSSERLALKGVESQLLAAMAASDKDFEEALIHSSDLLMALTRAEGAAIVTHEDIRRAGTTPPRDAIMRIAADLFARQQETFATDSLSETWPDAAEYADRASGMLAISISQIRPDYLFWFRPEVVRTVNWSGDPTKPMSAGKERLHPRQSFALWKEQVHQRCLPWTDVERDSATGFRSSIQNMILRGAEEKAELTDRLERANKELEAFSYSISHDLRAPFRHIVGFAELLSDREKSLDAKSQHYLRTISEAAHAAGRLVDDLLNFSQLGRASLRIKPVDMNALVLSVRRLLEPELAGRDVTWRIDDLPQANGDAVMITQVFQNLLQNAIKFTATRTRAEISITAEDDGDRIAYTVADNGVGFEMDYSDKLFGVFQRLHSAEEFPGTGIGLALVKRIVMRHGGTISGRGAPDAGAAFTFSLPRRPITRDAGPPHG